MSNSGYPLNEYPTQEELISSQTPIQPQIQTPIQPQIQNPIQPQIQNPIQPQIQNPIIITQGVQTNQASQPFIVSSQQILPSNVQTINSNLISLKSFPVSCVCPLCGYSGYTKTINSFNIINFLCCWFTDPICWCCFQLCRGKDLNCNDAVHYCPRCHVVLGNYSAC